VTTISLVRKSAEAKYFTLEMYKSETHLVQKKYLCMWYEKHSLLLSQDLL
jgi:hypothetical protein